MNLSLLAIFFFCSFVFNLSAREIDQKKLSDDFREIMDKGQYTQALNFLNEVIKNHPSDKKLYRCYAMKSIVYKALVNYDEVFENLEISLKLTDRLVNPDSARAYLNTQFAFAYFDTQKYDEAYGIMQELKKIDQNLINRENKVWLVMQEGYIQILRKNYRSAKTLLDESIEIARTVDIRMLPNIYAKHIILFNEMKDYKARDSVFRKGLHIADSTEIFQYSLYLHDEMSRALEQVGDFEAQVKILKAHDSLKTAFNLQEINERGAIVEKDFLKYQLESERKLKGIYSYFLLGGALFIISLLIFAFILWQKIKIIRAQSKQNSDIVSMIIHDIREPLLGVSILLSRIKLEDQYLNTASESIKNQLKAINKMLNTHLSIKKRSFAVSDGGAYPKLEIDQTVREVLHHFDMVIKEKGLSIRMDFGQPLELPLYEEELYIVLYNLISNAIKHSKYGATIHISNTAKGLFVEDEGIFSDDYSIPTSDFDSVSAGVGLKLVRAIIEKRKVDLKLISLENGKGTRACVVPL